ncbi:hypothetical protein Q5752_000484 [Cryptotrichosporon argae]
MASRLPSQPASLPPIGALFLAHFDDTAGQAVVFFASSDDLHEGTIEHACLPSGLHAVRQDAVFFSHGGRPAVGLFRSRDVDEGRGKRMGTVGVVLASGAPEDLFSVLPVLENIYDRLDALHVSPFSAAGRAGAATLLGEIWACARAPLGEDDESGSVMGRTAISPDHPITYLPSLLALLGPSIVTVYKTAISNRRILLYAPPPLLPLAAFAWCVWAMGAPPARAGTGARRPAWLGNVGLMDLAAVLDRTGGWVATTSDAIYRSHARAYDLFIDLSTPNPILTLSTPSASSPSSAQPSTATTTYSFADLPLYRALLPSHARGGPVPAVKAGLWLLVYLVAERAWALCVGVAEYAIGKGRVGAVRLGDETLLGDAEGEEEAEEDAGADTDTDTDTDDASRRGREILRRLEHQTHHVFLRLAEVRAAAARSGSGTANDSGSGGRKHALSDAELRLLGVKRQTAEGRFWDGAAGAWGPRR